MKSCHAAALAIVVWYLITPNRLPNSTQHDVRAPLSQWTKVENYATKDQCESAKALSIQTLNHPTNLGLDVAAQARKIGPAGMSEIRQALIASKCIATDDPRLKEK
jgi:hypothetical protein